MRELGVYPVWSEVLIVVVFLSPTYRREHWLLSSLKDCFCGGPPCMVLPMGLTYSLSSFSEAQPLEGSTALAIGVGLGCEKCLFGLFLEWYLSETLTFILAGSVQLC